MIKYFLLYKRVFDNVISLDDKDDNGFEYCFIVIQIKLHSQLVHQSNDFIVYSQIIQNSPKISRKTFLNKHVAPILRRYHIAKPLMRYFMCNDIRNTTTVIVTRTFRYLKILAAECQQSKVFHRSCSKIDTQQ